MRIIFLLIIVFFSCPQIVAQDIEPTEEDIKKYGFILAELSPTKPPTPSTLKRLDSLYQNDTNSFLLKGILSEKHYYVSTSQI